MISEYRIKAVIGFFVFLTVLAPAGNAATTADVAVKKCAIADSHAGQRECLIALAASVEVYLKTAEKAALQRIDKWDEDENYRTTAKVLFMKSIEAFSRYKEIQCDFLRTLAAGGNGAGDMQLECVVGLIKQRITQIESDTVGLTTVR